MRFPKSEQQLEKEKADRNAKRRLRYATIEKAALKTIRQDLINQRYQTKLENIAKCIIYLVKANPESPDLMQDLLKLMQESGLRLKKTEL